MRIDISLPLSLALSLPLSGFPEQSISAPLGLQTAALRFFQWLRHRNSVYYVPWLWLFRNSMSNRRGPRKDRCPTSHDTNGTRQWPKCGRLASACSFHPIQARVYHPGLAICRAGRALYSTTRHHPAKSWKLRLFLGCAFWAPCAHIELSLGERDHTCLEHTHTHSDSTGKQSGSRPCAFSDTKPAAGLNFSMTDISSAPADCGVCPDISRYARLTRESALSGQLRRSGHLEYLALRFQGLSNSTNIWRARHVSCQRTKWKRRF